MDTLTFGGSILYRHLTFSEAKKAPIMEVNLEKALEGLEMDMSTVRIVIICLLGLSFPAWDCRSDFQRLAFVLC
jgi:flap endonuclease-1